MSAGQLRSIDAGTAVAPRRLESAGWSALPPAPLRWGIQLVAELGDASSAMAGRIGLVRMILGRQVRPLLRQTPLAAASDYGVTWLSRSAFQSQRRYCLLPPSNNNVGRRRPYAPPPAITPVAISQSGCMIVKGIVCHDCIRRMRIDRRIST